MSVHYLPAGTMEDATIYQEDSCVTVPLVIKETIAKLVSGVILSIVMNFIIKGKGNPKNL